MIDAALLLTGAALQLIGTTLIFDIPTTPQWIGAALQLIGTNLIFDIRPLK